MLIYQEVNNIGVNIMEERYKMFTILIAKCSRAIKRIKSNEMHGLQLKSFHVSCLYYLYINGKPMTSKELCLVCDEDKAHVSRCLEALESEGYVVCSSKTQKRYNSPISLTEKGELVAKEVAKKIDNIVNEASKGLSEENRKIFYQSLTLISNNLEQICQKHGE